MGQDSHVSLKSVVTGPAASALPQSLVEMQILRSIADLLSNTWHGCGSLWFNKPAGDLMHCRV